MAKQKKAIEGRTEPEKLGETATILDFIQKVPALKSFREAIHKAEFDGFLNQISPLTVFIPTDDTFDKLPRNVRSSLFKEKLRLMRVVKSHIIFDKIVKEDIADMEVVRTATGGLLNVSMKGTEIWLDNARIVDSDIQCLNGIIHIIDGVLWPTKSFHQSWDRILDPGKGLDINK
jgi:uncharacterized surface protein with fasciclin (FAS1) repeats